MLMSVDGILNYGVEKSGAGLFGVKRRGMHVFTQCGLSAMYTHSVEREE